MTTELLKKLASLLDAAIEETERHARGLRLISDYAKKAAEDD